MHDLDGAPAEADATSAPESAEEKRNTVSTHVLVAEEQVERLRDLSRRTRVSQSTYLREAVEDLLAKYAALPGEPK